jgi:hypothetical protein
MTSVRPFHCDEMFSSVMLYRDTFGMMVGPMCDDVTGSRNVEVSHQLVVYIYLSTYLGIHLLHL